MNALRSLHSFLSGPPGTPALGRWAWCLGSLALLGMLSPPWLQHLAVMAAGHGLVALGVVAMMRGGVVSFGQGAAFACGGYIAAWLPMALGVHDLLVLLAASALGATLLSAPFSWLLASYRGIFFSTLTLALSMVVFGLLSKCDTLGGSDGLNAMRPSLLGIDLASDSGSRLTYLVALAVTAGMAAIAHRHFHSESGGLSMAARDNEIRVTYLGASVRRLMRLNHLFAAWCAGLGGAMVVTSLGHVEPQFSYWTTSGEFVFVAVLAGCRSVPAVFLSAALLEAVRSVAGAHFPLAWQMLLGAFLLLVIRFLPQGLGSLWAPHKETA